MAGQEEGDGGLPGDYGCARPRLLSWLLLPCLGLAMEETGIREGLVCVDVQ